jgi:dihydroorotase
MGARAAATKIQGNHASRSKFDRGAFLFVDAHHIGGRLVPKNSLVIRGGRVVDPSQGLDALTDVVVRDGKVDALVEPGASIGLPDFDARDRVVAPGLVDLHVHLRVPGFERKETIATGTAAAAAGGFTSICCMPNTVPPLDSVDSLAKLAEQLEREAGVRVFPIATISKGRLGDEAVDFEALAKAGAIGFSDDGDTTRSSLVMRRALEASRALELPIMVHCEDKALAAGAMTEGVVSRRLGITGIPAAAEEIVIARDLMLARLTGGWLHVLHVSTGRGIDLIQAAKVDGINVTCEVMPHHLVMSERWVAGERTLHNVNEPAGEKATPADPNTKVNPPLRTVEDTHALVTALRSGRFDVIATDHAPHAEPDKSGSSFERAAFGLSGLEFAVPLCLALVRAGHLSLNDLIFRMATVPGRLLGKGGGTLQPGSPADITVVDPDREWAVTPNQLRTKSHNTPLMGMTLRGRPIATFVAGELRFGI